MEKSHEINKFMSNLLVENIVPSLSDNKIFFLFSLSFSHIYV